MSATNSTTNYNLPIFIASDSPKWLVDWNGAMNTIDSAINTVATAASGAAGDITSLQSDLQTLSGTVTTQGTSISTLTSSLSTLTGTVNTITSLIGNGEPTTTDKTIIGAINELHSDIQQIVVSVDADDVSYDNTTSGLLATNVQSAIDELAASAPTPTPTNQKEYVFIFDSYGVNGLSDYAAAAAPGHNHVLDVGGGGFIGAVGGTSWESELSTYLQSLTTTQRNAITDIMIFGGINDIGHTTADIVNAINSFNSVVTTYAPNANVTLAPCSYSVRKDGSMGDYAQIVLPAYSEASASLNWKFVNGLNAYIHDTSLMTSNDVHPTAAGIAKMGVALKNFILTGNLVKRFTAPKAATCTPVGASSTLSANNKFTSRISGDNVILQGRIVVTLNPNITSQVGATPITIETISDTEFFGIDSGDRGIGWTLTDGYVAVSDSVGFIHRTMAVRVCNGSIQIMMEGPALGGNIMSIQTTDFTITLPLDLC